jgi:hypothetical protein
MSHGAPNLWIGALSFFFFFKLLIPFIINTIFWVFSLFKKYNFFHTKLIFVYNTF